MVNGILGEDFILRSLVLFLIPLFHYFSYVVFFLKSGVGGDASLILFKVWHIENFNQSYSPDDRGVNMSRSQLIILHENSLQRKIAVVESVYRNSALSLILTSLTTAAAFFSSFVSSITSIACFGYVTLFSGNL